MSFKNILLLLIISILYSSCKTQNDIILLGNTSINKTKREYFILNIDSTKRYYLLETILIRDSVLLVIYKKSKQLRKNKIEIGKKFKFKTYDRLDVIPNIDYFHEVDGKIVWSGFNNNSFKLHFTDGMGNGFLESLNEISDTITD